MSGFFEHRQATPPASWWSNHWSRRLTSAEDWEAELSEQTQASGVADVTGHEPGDSARGLLTAASFSAEQRKRYATSLQQILDPVLLANLVRRRTLLAESGAGPAGLLFAPPRAPLPDSRGAEPGQGGAGSNPSALSKPDPLEVKLRKAVPGLSTSEQLLLSAAIANLAGHPDQARGWLNELGGAAESERESLLSLIEREQEASCLLEGDSKSPLRYGYHRVLAMWLGWRPFEPDAAGAAISSMDWSSPWRWAALRLILPQLMAASPGLIEPLMDQKSDEKPEREASPTL